MNAQSPHGPMILAPMVMGQVCHGLLERGGAGSDVVGVPHLPHTPGFLSHTPRGKCPTWTSLGLPATYDNGPAHSPGLR